MFAINLLIFVFFFECLVTSVPIIKNDQQPQPLLINGLHNVNDKKDVFLSRGWGAGGMPFSVLYMNPSKAPIQVQQNVPTSNNINAKIPEKNTQSSSSYGATNTRRKNTNYNIIPQLFVSYGWGPLGK